MFFDFCFVFFGGNFLLLSPSLGFSQLPLSLSLFLSLSQNTKQNTHKNVYRTFTGTLRVTDSNPVDTEISLEVKRQGILDRSGNSAEEDLFTDFTTGACVKLSSYPVGNPYIYIDDAWRPTHVDISFGTTIMDVTRFANVPDTTLVRRQVKETHIPRTQFGSMNVRPTPISLNVERGNLYETHFDRQDCLSGNSIGVTCTCEDALSIDAGTKVGSLLNKKLHVLESQRT